MKNKRKIAALLLAVLVLLSQALPVFALDCGDTVRIRDVEDLLELAQYCRLDSWSVGKTVILEVDLSLEGVDFAPIPTFGGTFDGKGHTISGLELVGSYAPAGLFGVLQDTAVVSDLTVKGVVAPTGNANAAGGIAGENYGVIQNCRFEGTLTGETNVGGIAGINASSGAISCCQASGAIVGENMTGGIVGQNAGLISRCENIAQVNTVSLDSALKLEELSADFLLDITKWTTLDTSVSTMDTGGIAGYNIGSILSCNNAAQIGYPHVGYNVGGIAGRTCGYLFDCQNSGIVHGRKDVGGIAGQMEPNISLNLSEDTIAKLKTELETLKEMLTDLKESGLSAAGSVHSRIDTILTYLDSATQNAESMGQAAGDYAGAVTGEINRVSLIISDVLTELETITEQLAALSGTVSTGLAQLETAFAEFAAAAEMTQEALAHLNDAIDDLDAAMEDTEAAQAQISAGLEDLEKAFSQGDENQIKVALQKIQAGFTALSGAAARAAAAVETIESLVSGTGAMPEEAVRALRELGIALKECADAMALISEGVGMLPADPNLDTEAFASGITSIRSGFASMNSAVAHIKDATEDFEKATEDAEAASGQMAAALNTLSGAMGTFSDAAAQMGDISRSAQNLLASVNAQSPMQIPEPGEELEKSAEGMFASVNSMSDELKTLNRQLESYGTEAAEKMDAIAAKFEEIVGLALEIVGQTLNPDTDDILSDTSDADVDAITLGKLYGCTNEGAVEGDLNIGGICGSMAVEYELDPEDDLSASITGTQQRMYEMKAIMQACVNSGIVTAKRSYAGGAVGQMNLGLVLECENYGTVKSESGDYVGGIAGISGAKIKECFVKCGLSGRNYIGGITGSGVEQTIGGAVSSVTGCYAMVHIDSGKQYLGAISGGKAGQFAENWFVSQTLAGINGISYAGMAEPMAYDELLELDQLPENFHKLTVSFVADGEILQTQLVSYGQSLDEAAYPAIPQKDGHYALWDQPKLSGIRFDTVVEVVYTPYMTTLASSALRTNGRTVLLVEGLFREGDSLACQPVIADQFPEVAKTWQEMLRGSFLDGVVYREVVEQWQLAIPEDDAKSHTIRYLVPEKSGNLAVYVKDGNAWERVETEVRGSYLCFAVEDGDVEFAVLSYTNTWWVWLIPVALIGAAAIGIVAIVRAAKKKKPTSAEEENE